MNCFGIQAGNNWLVFTLHVKKVLLLYVFSVGAPLRVYLHIYMYFCEYGKERTRG